MKGYAGRKRLGDSIHRPYMFLAGEKRHAEPICAWFVTGLR
jgi:hypothetical protein